MADLNRLVSIEDLRQAARRRLPRAIFDFFDGGAEDEVTLRENRAAFERVRLLPKVLVNVAKVDMSAEIFGNRSTLPLAIAPTGGISAGRAGAELSLARAVWSSSRPCRLGSCSAACRAWRTARATRSRATARPTSPRRWGARWTLPATGKRSSAFAASGRASFY